jgi:DNA-binding NarL/FixJ family response regulator
MIRVAVVDDQALVRAGFVVLLESAPDLEVVGSAADGAQAFDLVVEARPDVVLMDIRMPVMDGLEATRRILGDPRCGDVRILILTTFDLDEYVYAALQAGASGFLLKDTPPAELLAGVRVVAGGDALLSPGITRHLIEAFVQRPADVRHLDARPLDVLTERERDVLALVAKGLSNAEIAARLYISPATVKTHIARTLTKLDARDRAQLIVIAYESRLVRPGEA